MAAKKKENLVRTAAPEQEDAKPRARKYGGLLSFEAGVAVFTGYGAQERRVPAEEVAIPGTMAARDLKLGKKAPCIVLDSGEVVWESECIAFFQEDEMRPHLERADQVKAANMKDHRARLRRSVEETRSKRRVRSERPEATTEATKAEHEARVAERDKGRERHEELRTKTLGELKGKSKPAKRGARTTP